MSQENNIHNGYQVVAEEGELAAGESKLFEMAGRELILCNAGGTLYVIENKCPHAGASFEGGRIRGKFISCPLHGSRFDLTTGKCLGGAYKPVLCFGVKVEDGKVWVDATSELELIATAK